MSQPGTKNVYYGQRWLASIAAIVCASVLFWNPTRSDAWGDTGHLLVGTIAKLNIKPESVKKIEFVLAQTANGVKRMDKLVFSSVWLDHMACNIRIQFCRGFNGLPAFRLFTPIHYSSLIYNPTNIPITGYQKYQPLPETGSVWALKSVYKELLSTDIPPCTTGPDPWHCPHKNAVGPEPAEVSSGLGYFPYPDNIYGSLNGLGLNLRVLLHLMGDIHQPLHNIETYWPGSTHGDAGSNAVKVRYTNDKGRTVTGTLHHVWDDAGLAYVHSFYTYDEETLEKMATDLMKQYPRESYGSRLSGRLRGDNFYALTKESHDIAVKEAYSEIDIEHFYTENSTYVPSKEYFAKVTAISQSQIVLAGYRLAFLLEAIAEKLPLVPDTSDDSGPWLSAVQRTVGSFHSSIGNMAESSDYTSYLLALLFTVLTALCFAGWFLALRYRASLKSHTAVRPGPITRSRAAAAAAAAEPFIK